MTRKPVHRGGRTWRLPAQDIRDEVGALKVPRRAKAPVVFRRVVTGCIETEPVETVKHRSRVRAKAQYVGVA